MIIESIEQTALDDLFCETCQMSQVAPNEFKSLEEMRDLIANSKLVSVTLDASSQMWDINEVMNRDGEEFLSWRGCHPAPPDDIDASELKALNWAYKFMTGALNGLPSKVEKLKA